MGYKCKEGAGFIDTAKIYLKAGGGGDGCNSYERDQAGRIVKANGGSGGKGGDVIFRADENTHTLLDFQYRRHFGSQRGKHASSNNKKGAYGEDTVVRVPAGTLIKDHPTGGMLADLIRPGDTFLACKGGEGGLGNSRFRPAEKGHEGEEKTVLLELKLIADVGIVGYPNAGKSTLISRISNARPKIADYPFTTKGPALGVVRYKGHEFVVADIPGLIEGAHKGRGLGDKFLRHIERTKVLIHLVDMSGLSCRDPVEDYRRLNKELEFYSKDLARKPQIIAANKMDAGKTAKDALTAFKEGVKRKKVAPISAKNSEGLDGLLLSTARMLKKA